MAAKIAQCSSNDSIWRELRCQGAKNHTEPHWCYNGNGDFIQWKNESDNSKEWKNIAESDTPPDHKSWIHPKDMHDKYWMGILFKEEKEILRQKRLEKNRKERVKKNLVIK